MAKVVILSGAGISAESGISTFRDSGGMWENYKIEDVCSAGCLKKNRDMTLDFYDARRTDIKDKNPNYAHLEIKKLKDKYPNDIAIITQNVDNLFERAGVKDEDITHLHGFLTSVRCTNERCDFKVDIGYEALEKTRVCPKCQSKLRPDIVFFGEAAPMYAKLFKSFDDCEFFVVIGTSGNVINTDMFLHKKIKHSILNNLYVSDAIDDTLYSKVLYKKATEAIDEIVSDVESFLASNHEKSGS